MKPEQRTAKWETVHLELTNMHLQADSMFPVCFHCRSTGHYATNCPSKATGARSNGETGNMFRNAATNVHQAFRSTATHHNTVPAIEPTRYTVNRNAQSRGSCSRFNRGIFCSKPPCQFAHTCNKCNQGHPGSQCQYITNTSFLPPTQ